MPLIVQGYGGPTNPVLHRRRGLQNPAHFFNDANDNGRIPWYSTDSGGTEFPKPVVYYPPSHTPPEYRESGPVGPTERVLEGIGRFTVEDPVSPESPVEHLSLTVASLPTNDPESGAKNHQQPATTPPSSSSPINLGPLDGSHRLQSVAEAST